MDPLFINKEKIASLLPMDECITVMEKMFRSLSAGECTQPLRSLMWMPDKSGLLGMMPGFVEKLGVIGIKVISVFPGNHETGLPSHQGMVILFDSKHGTPLMIFDAAEITAIRTAAASAVATDCLARKNAETLAIIGSGEQAKRHIEALLLVRSISQIYCWSRNAGHAESLCQNISNRFNVAFNTSPSAREAVLNADIVCTVTSSREPLIRGEWIRPGTHINAVGYASVAGRELDTTTIVKSKLFTDCYESVFNEAGDFLIPKKEGAVTNDHVKGEIGEVLLGRKMGRENDEEITVFKSLGIAVEDIFSAFHIYQKLKA